MPSLDHALDVLERDRRVPLVGQVSDPGVLLLGLVAWSRVHGIVSLEIEGFHEQVGVNPDLLYEAEIQHLIDQRNT